MKCSARAYTKCPDAKFCGTLENAVCCEGSECDKFNRQVESQPLSMQEKIQAMSAKELTDFLLYVDQGNMTVDCCDEKYCDPEHCPHDCTEAMTRYLQSPGSEVRLW